MLVTTAGVHLQASAQAASPSWATIIIATSAGVALVVVIARWIWWPSDASTRPGLGQRVGPANWSFAESWASTLTAFGAVLGMILLSQVLPAEGRYVSPRSVALLNLLFGFLVVLAPFVYAATSVRVQASGAPADTPPAVSYEGVTATFLLASVITLWAALGEVATIALTAAELSPPGFSFYLFGVVLAAVGALMIFYAWRSIRWVLEVQSEHETRARLLAPGTAPTGRPAWTLL